MLARLFVEQKPPKLQRSVAHVVRGELVNPGRRREQGTGGVNGEGRGIVIGMAAFIRVGQERSRLA